MARPSDADLTALWRALGDGDPEAGEGWRSILVHSDGGPRLFAAVSFPERLEAVLAGFDAGALPPARLPKGNGFMIEVMDPGPAPVRIAWYALTRAAGASPDLFLAMAEDVSSVLRQHAGASENRLLQIFMARVRLWQQFMSDPRDRVLSPEAELGLIGELEMFERLLDAGLEAGDVARAWQGPFEEVHDYSLGQGAAEVKCSLSAVSFQARISSLDQLDDGQLSPIFIAAFRCTVGDDAPTLPERVARIRTRLAGLGSTGAVFERALLHTGYRDEHAGRYTRRIHTSEPRLLPAEQLPRLRRSELDPAIRAAVYELDLDMVDVTPVPFLEALTTLGVTVDDA